MLLTIDAVCVSMRVLYLDPGSLSRLCLQAPVVPLTSLFSVHVTYSCDGPQRHEGGESGYAGELCFRILCYLDPS